MQETPRPVIYVHASLKEIVAAKKETEASEKKNILLRRKSQPGKALLPSPSLGAKPRKFEAKTG